MLVKFNATRLLGFQGKLILPGVNDLDDHFVADMQDDHILADKFDRGELEILDREELGAEKAKPKKGQPLSGVDLLLAASDKNAKNLAAQTVDLAILETWLLREKRVPVKKAVRDQIAKIKNIQYRDEKSKTKLEKAPSGKED